VSLFGLYNGFSVSLNLFLPSDVFLFDILAIAAELGEALCMLEISYRLNSPSCIAEAVDDDLIVINLATGRYYNMRHETVACWQALIQGITPAALLAGNTWEIMQVTRFKDFVTYLVDEQLLVQQQSLPDNAMAPNIELGMRNDPFMIDVFTDMEEMLLLDPIHDASTDAGWPHKA
jgi:hypothetical protein